jgi:epoxyqueuosine reductase
LAEKNAEKLNTILDDLEVDMSGIASLGGVREEPEMAKAERLLPGAKSIISLAMEIPLEVFRHLSFRQEVGDLALRDLYHQTEQLIGGRLNWEAYKLVKKLHSLGYRALALPAGGPYNMRFLEGPVSYKHAAQAAGLGYIGKNSLLVTPQYGPRVKLAAVVTDAGLNPSIQAAPEVKCARCGACIKACPAHAIRQPGPGQTYSLDVHACNSFLSAVGLCAECMKVCPRSK